LGLWRTLTIADAAPAKASANVSFDLGLVRL
jgi:hypothetical protein